MVLGISFVVGLLFMFLMRYCGGFLTWFIIFLYFSLLTVLGVMCILWSRPDAENNLPPELDDKEALQIIGYVLLAVDLISFLLFICFFSRI